MTPEEFQKAIGPHCEAKRRADLFRMYRVQYHSRVTVTAFTDELKDDGVENMRIAFAYRLARAFGMVLAELSPTFDERNWLTAMRDGFHAKKRRDKLNSTDSDGPS